MRTKQLFYMLCGLVVVVAIIVIGNKMATKTPGKSDRLLFPKLTRDNIAAIEIFDGDSTIKVAKIGGKWVVPVFENYRADTGNIGSAVTALLELEKKDLVSTNPAKQAKFEVDTTKGRRIVVKGKADEVLADFYVGKTGSDWRSEYVRFYGKNEVYASDQTFKWKFKTSHEDWKDRRLLDLDKRNVENVTLHHDTVRLALAKKGDGSWELTEPLVVPADTAKVNDFLQQVCDMRTDEWAEDKDSSKAKKALRKTTVKVSLKEGDGNEHIVTVGDSLENYYYAKVSGDSTVFKIHSYKRDKLLKQWKDFEQPPDTTKIDSTADTTKADTAKIKKIKAKKGK